MELISPWALVCHFSPGSDKSQDLEDLTDEMLGVKMAAGSSSLHSFTCCTLCSASTNPRRAIDGISASLLSMEQGEALRMLRGVLFFSLGRGSRSGPSLPPPCSPLPSLVSLRLGKEKALVHRRGATGEAARQEGELRESLTGFCCVVVVVAVASRKDRPPPSSSSPSSSSSERAVIRPSPSLHWLAVHGAAHKKKKKKKKAKPTGERCLATRARRTSPASQWVSGRFFFSSFSNVQVSCGCVWLRGGPAGCGCRMSPGRHAPLRPPTVPELRDGSSRRAAVLCAYVFVHVHLPFHRENLQKTHDRVDQSIGRWGRGTVCVCVCVEGGRKKRDFFFFFCSIFATSAPVRGQKEFASTFIFKRRSALGSLVFVPGMHAMTVEISRRWSLLGGVCVFLCVCVCVCLVARLPFHTHQLLGGQMLTLHPPRSLTPPAWFSPFTLGRRRGWGWGEDCILQEKARKGAAKSIEGGTFTGVTDYFPEFIAGAAGMVVAAEWKVKNREGKGGEPVEREGTVGPISFHVSLFPSLSPSLPLSLSCGRCTQAEAELIRRGGRRSPSERRWSNWVEIVRRWLRSGQNKR